MSTARRPRLLHLATILCLCLATGAPAADKATREKQLKNVLQKIEKLKQTIDVKEDSKSQYIKQLKSIERKIGKVNREIRDIGQKISNKKSELKALRATRAKHQKKLSQENEYLAEQVYAAFTLGRQERVKLLFSQQDPETLQRNLVYYQYFSNARVDLIEGVQENIDKIVATEALIQQARRDLEKNQQSLATRKKKLNQDRGKRKSIIGSLDKQLKQQSGKLSRLEDEAQQLQELIDSIQEFFDAAPEGEIKRRAFSDLKGKLA